MTKFAVITQKDESAWDDVNVEMYLATVPCVKAYVRTITHLLVTSAILWRS